MAIREFIKGKQILVTGGTGSFGHQIVSRLLGLEPARIVIFSRDEKKQYDMQHELGECTDILDFVIGDIRDYTALNENMRNIHIVYHAAALKQVPNCEYHPFEAVKTNILGAENVRRAAVHNGVETVVAISTDKAVKPVNVMGMTKALQEKIILNPRNGNCGTRFLCVRYGNVIGSRGSVIPLFKKRLDKGLPLPVTCGEMTRFLLTLQQAINLVFEATIAGENGQLFVKKMPACYIQDLAEAMARAVSGRDDYPIQEIGVRPGEKIHEILVSEEEMRRSVETEDHYIIYPPGGLERPHLLRDIHEYASNNTTILDQNQITTLLRQEGWV